MFLFKGNRNYVHGSDIYNYVTSIEKKKYKKLSIKFSKIIKKNIVLKVHKIRKIEQLKLKNKPHVNALFEFSNYFINYSLFESKKDIQGKYYYDENLMNFFFKIKKNNSYCNFITSYSSIEVLIALNKYFHNKKIKKAKWLFSKLILRSELLEKNKKKFEIILVNNKFNRYTSSRILQNNKEIGIIEFTRND